MKMRQKLMAVLAASMVVSSVPVITMADTTNYVSTNRYAKKDTTFGFLKSTDNGNTYVYGQSSTTQKPTDGYNYLYSNGFEFSPRMNYTQPGTMYMSLTKDTEFDAQAVITYVDSFNHDATSNLYTVKNAAGKDVIKGASTAAYNDQLVEDVIKAGVTMYINQAIPVTNNTVAQPYGTSALDVNGLKAAIANALRANASSIYTAISDIDLANAIVNEIVANGGTSVISILQPNVIEKAVAKVVNNNNTATVTTGSALVTSDDFTINQATLAGRINSNFTTVVMNAIKNFTNVPATTITIKKVEAFDVKDAADREYKNHLRVDFDGRFNKDETYKIPLLAKIGGDKVAILNIDGNDSFVSNGKYPLTQDVVSDKRTTLEADSEKVRTNTMDPIGKLKIKETSIGTLASKDNRKIKITLPSSSDLQFNLEKTLGTAVATGKRGFYGKLTDVKNNKNFLANNGYINNQTAYIEQLGRALATSEKSTTGLRISYDVSSRRNSYTDVDKQTLIIELPNWSDATSTGEIELAGLYVEPVDGTAAVGDVMATIEEYLAPGWSSTNTVSTYGEAQYDGNGDYTIYSNVQYYELDNNGFYVPVNYSQATYANRINRSNKKLYVIGSGSNTVSGAASTSQDLVKTQTLKVAEVAAYDIKLTCKDDPMKSIKAGRSGVANKNKVTFELEENVKDSLVDTRKVEFTLDNGYIFGPADVDYSDNAANSNGFVTTGIYGSTSYKQKALVKFKELINNKTIELGEKGGSIIHDSIELKIDAEGRVTGFAALYKDLKVENADKIKVTIPLATDVMAKGVVKVSASNIYTRSFQDKKEDATCEIATILSPIDVTFDGAKLKVGKQAQEAGTITIKESDKGMIEKGWMFLAADNQTGITFDSVPTVTVEGTDGKTLVITNAALSKDKTMLGFEVTKTSLDASTIKISGINLTADRTVPEANYDLAIWGSALTDENVLGITNFTQNALYSQAYFNQASDLFTVKDFIQMTTVNTEDLSNSAKAATAAFKIGENKFTVNGETVSMDNATAYIKDNLTFVPVRYVAQAFGIAGNAVQFDGASGTVTIVAGDKVINMTNGKAYITVNGTNVPMQTKAEIKDGRMCVPMAYIASALGVEKSWEPSTKTATFTNQKSK